MVGFRAFWWYFAHVYICGPITKSKWLVGLGGSIFFHPQGGDIYPCPRSPFATDGDGWMMDGCVWVCVVSISGSMSAARSANVRRRSTSTTSCHTRRNASQTKPSFPPNTVFIAPLVYIKISRVYFHSTLLLYAVYFSVLVLWADFSRSYYSRSRPDLCRIERTCQVYGAGRLAMQSGLYHRSILQRNAVC